MAVEAEASTCIFLESSEEDRTDHETPARASVVKPRSACNTKIKCAERLAESETVPPPEVK